MTAAAAARLELKTSGTPNQLAGVALLLHGGRARSQAPVRRTSLAAARMRPFAAAILRRSGLAAIGVGLLRNHCQGWNGARADPVEDALWALEEIAQQWGPVPVVLVGHSMGGRTALRVAGHPHVTAVAALAPWVPEDEPIGQLAGRDLLIAHAPDDRVTDPVASRDYARRAEAIAARVEHRSMAEGGHAMLRGAAEWHRMVADFTADHLPLPALPMP